jgi:hypothetical protein
MSQWGTVADWFVAAGTLVLAVVAVFQETIRAWSCANEASADASPIRVTEDGLVHSGQEIACSARGSFSPV